ncbi:hypothetical protein SDC9_137152 [bioreactor metagenome]|uniref:Uncharacterized protein n=1 Tax=bioreactor metagenome TaxID=1076179 RepID=A0A645DL39_9ZZZZ
MHRYGNSDLFAVSGICVGHCANSCVVGAELQCNPIAEGNAVDRYGGVALFVRASHDDSSGGGDLRRRHCGDYRCCHRRVFRIVGGKGGVKAGAAATLRIDACGVGLCPLPGSGERHAALTDDLSAGKGQLGQRISIYAGCAWSCCHSWRKSTGCYAAYRGSSGNSHARLRRMGSIEGIRRIGIQAGQGDGITITALACRSAVYQNRIHGGSGVTDGDSQYADFVKTAGACRSILEGCGESNIGAGGSGSNRSRRIVYKIAAGADLHAVESLWQTKQIARGAGGVVLYVISDTVLGLRAAGAPFYGFGISAALCQAYQIALRRCDEGVSTPGRRYSGNSGIDGIAFCAVVSADSQRISLVRRKYKIKSVVTGARLT